MTHEFIDREHQLPADPRSASGVNSSGEAQSLALQTTKPGEPAKGFDVRAVYDSRPVQGFDFNIVSSGESGTGSFVITLGFNVPAGYVAVLRQIRHSFSLVPAILAEADVLLTLKINRGVFQYNTNIPVGLTRDVDFFAIADENVPVEAEFTVPAVAQTSTLYAHFYGQFLLKTGVPSIFEIANPSDRAILAAIPPQRAPMPEPISAPVQKRQPLPVMAPTPPTSPPPEVPPPPIIPARAAPVRGALRPASAGRSPIYDRAGRIVGYR